MNICLLPETRRMALEAVNNAPDGSILEIRESNRTLSQNRFYWELLRTVELQLKPEGRKYNAEVWHEYFKARYLIPKMMELPNGKLKEVERTTTDLSKKEFSDYIEQVMAFASEHGAVWSNSMLQEFPI